MTRSPNALTLQWTNVPVVYQLESAVVPLPNAVWVPVTNNIGTLGFLSTFAISNLNQTQNQYLRLREIP